MGQTLISCPRFDYAQVQSDGRDTFEYGFGMTRGIFELVHWVLQG